jgi:hypothetical protein
MEEGSSRISWVPESLPGVYFWLSPWYLSPFLRSEGGDRLEGIGDEAREYCIEWMIDLVDGRKVEAVVTSRGAVAFISIKGGCMPRFAKSSAGVTVDRDC